MFPFWFYHFNNKIPPIPRYSSISQYEIFRHYLNHWGRVTHICVGKLTIIGSDNGLSPGRCQAINQCWNIVNWTLGTNFSEILIEIDTFSFKKMHLKMSSAKWRPFRLGLNVLTHWQYLTNTAKCNSIRDVPLCLKLKFVLKYPITSTQNSDSIGNIWKDTDADMRH